MCVLYKILTSSAQNEVDTVSHETLPRYYPIPIVPVIFSAELDFSGYMICYDVMRTCRNACTERCDVERRVRMSWTLVRLASWTWEAENVTSWVENTWLKFNVAFMRKYGTSFSWSVVRSKNGILRKFRISDVKRYYNKTKSTWPSGAWFCALGEGTRLWRQLDVLAQRDSCRRWVWGVVLCCEGHWRSRWRGALCWDLALVKWYRSNQWTPLSFCTNPETTLNPGRYWNSDVTWR